MWESRGGVQGTGNRVVSANVCPAPTRHLVLNGAHCRHQSLIGSSSHSKEVVLSTPFYSTRSETEAHRIACSIVRNVSSGQIRSLSQLGHSLPVLKCLVPPFPHPYNGNDRSTHLIGSLGKLNILVCVEYSEGLARSKPWSHACRGCDARLTGEGTEIHEQLRIRACKW